jgi:hypothetical protein
MEAAFHQATVYCCALIVTTNHADSIDDLI